MKQTVTLLSKGLLAALLGIAGYGGTISFTPPLQTINAGDSGLVSVVIGGTTAGAPPSVGAFDLKLAYNPSVVMFTGATFSNLLGNIGLLEALSSTNPGSGAVEVSETSLLSGAALDALQPDTFTLATFAFKGIGNGTSPLTITSALISDANALNITQSFTLSSGSITVTVPEPGTALTIMAGVGFLALWIRRRNVNG